MANGALKRTASTDYSSDNEHQNNTASELVSSDSSSELHYLDSPALEELGLPLNFASTNRRGSFNQSKSVENLQGSTETVENYHLSGTRMKRKKRKMPRLSEIYIESTFYDLEKFELDFDENLPAEYLDYGFDSQGPTDIKLSSNTFPEKRADSDLKTLGSSSRFIDNSSLKNISESEPKSSHRLEIECDLEGSRGTPETFGESNIGDEIETSKKGIGYRKFFRQRYDLFKKFDEGIQMDDEGFFSVTPERIALHIADKTRTCTEANLIWDAFTGVGGNTIQFALEAAAHVVTTDTCMERLVMAQCNARVYGVSQYIDFICIDSLRFPNAWRKCQAIDNGKEDAWKPKMFEAAFASPPWGGPSYLKKDVYDPITMLPVNCDQMMQSMSSISDFCVVYLPRNTDVQAFLMYAKSLCLWKGVEVEYHWLDDRPKVIVMYFQKSKN